MPSCSFELNPDIPGHEWSLSAQNTETLETRTIRETESVPGRATSVSFALPHLPPGTYDLTLKLTDSAGKTRQTIQTVQWYWEDPDRLTVSIVDPDEAIEVEPGEMVSFTVRVEAPRLIERIGERYVVDWDFRDGTEIRDLVDISSGASGDSSRTHTFNEEGAHLVQVRVEGNVFGLSGSDQLLVDVGLRPTPQPPAQWVLSKTLIVPKEPQITEAKVFKYGGLCRVDLTETSASIDIRQVMKDGGQNNVAFEFQFDKPPAVLQPGETVTLHASGNVTTEGTLVQGSSYVISFGYDVKGSTERLRGILPTGPTDHFMLRAPSEGRQTSGPLTLKFQVPPLPSLDRPRGGIWFFVQLSIRASACEGIGVSWTYVPGP